MSRFNVDLAELPKETSEISQKREPATIFSDQIAKQEAPSKFLKFLKNAGVVLLVLLIVGGLSGFFYWRSVKKTPSYSLAMLVEAARRDDQAQVENYVDMEAVVENFMPQVADKAVELYGRSLPPQVIAKVEQVAAPAIPVIKQRAKTELPQVIREKTAALEKVPYWMIALFADRAVEIAIEKDSAIIKSRIPERPLEIMMKRDGAQIWKVVGMKDEVLARKIAEKIGQDLIAAAAKGGIKKAAAQLGVKDLEALENMELFK